MSSKRKVLEHLTRDELLSAADRLAVAVADRRTKALLVDAVASSQTWRGGEDERGGRPRGGRSVL